MNARQHLEVTFKTYIFWITTFLLVSCNLFSQTTNGKLKILTNTNYDHFKTRIPLNTQPKTKAIIENGDTIPLYYLRDVYVYPPLTFKNKRQERFYWRTVRDVKRTLPLAKYIRGIIEDTSDTLITMSTESERRKYLRGFEKKLYKQEYDRMNQLTLNQGKLLIRLVSREMDASSFDLIKAYRGGFRAGFYQMFARLFGANLKWEYGSREEDQIIERVINLVESGQL